MKYHQHHDSHLAPSLGCHLLRISPFGIGLRFIPQPHGVADLLLTNKKKHPSFTSENGWSWWTDGVVQSSSPFNLISKKSKNQQPAQVNSPRGDPIIFCQFPQGRRFLLSSIGKILPTFQCQTSIEQGYICDIKAKVPWTWASSLGRTWMFWWPICCLYGKWFDSLSPATPCNINIEHVRCDLMISASFFCFLFNGNNGMIYSCTSIP